MHDRQAFLRDFEAGRRLDLMLVAAVTSVLMIRFYLVVTGYPTIGGESLHIAHMLWGGLLMAAALVLAASFLGRRPRQWAAVLGGLGFGTFIDEIGKFLTHDNDYFYEPAVSLIYVAMVLLYLGGRSLHRERMATRADYLANAMVEVLEVSREDLDRREQERALRYLDHAGDGSVADHVRAVLREAELVPVTRPGRAQRLAQLLVAAYRRIAATVWFGRLLITLFAAGVLVDILRLFALARLLPEAGETLLHVPLISALPLDTSHYTFSQWLQMGSTFLAGIFATAGIFWVFRDRLKALRMFQRSLLVSLFLTQVFIFYRVQWYGLIGLAVNLLVLAALRFMIEEERRLPA